MNTNTFTLVTGEPGAGKTTFIRNLLVGSKVVGVLHAGTSYPGLTPGTVIGSSHELVSGQVITVLGDFFFETDTHLGGGDVFNDLRQGSLTTLEAIKQVTRALPAESFFFDHWKPSRRLLKGLKEEFKLSVIYLTTSPEICEARRLERAARRGRSCIGTPAYIKSLQPPSFYQELGLQVDLIPN